MNFFSALLFDVLWRLKKDMTLNYSYLFNEENKGLVKVVEVRV